MTVLTIVGTADSRSEFEDMIEARLADGFNINAVIPLSVESDTQKFLAYVSQYDEDREYDASVVSAMVEFLGDEDLDAKDHMDAEAAGIYAEENYGKEAYSSFTDPITSLDMYKRDVLFGLIHTNEVTLFRARLGGKPVVALCHFSVGGKPNDAVATPLAILLDDELASTVELPVKSSYERGK